MNKLCHKEEIATEDIKHVHGCKVWSGAFLGRLGEVFRAALPEHASWKNVVLAERRQGQGLKIAEFSSKKFKSDVFPTPESHNAGQRVMATWLILSSRVRADTFVAVLIL